MHQRHRAPTELDDAAVGQHDPVVVVAAHGVDRCERAERVEHRGVGDVAGMEDGVGALEVCGLPPRDVMLVQPGTLPKTSSGKLQRAKCRELYLAEELELLA